MRSGFPINTKPQFLCYFSLYHILPCLSCFDVVSTYMVNNVICNHIGEPFQYHVELLSFSGLSSVTIFHLDNVCRGKQPPLYCTVTGGR